MSCSEELQNVFQYMKLQNNLPVSMLAVYHQWMLESVAPKGMTIQESEFHIIPVETIQGSNSDKKIEN